MNVIQNIATMLDTLRRNGGNHEPSQDALEYLVRNYLPSGSGVDSGCAIDLDRQKPGRIVIDCSFHHMNEGGYYDGWTEHQVIVTPCFGHWPDIRVTGRNRNDIKEYLGELFRHALDQPIEKVWNKDTQSWSFTRV
jgi:hypothetical protein